MRRAAKVDRNQAEIVEALRDAGAVVTHMHTLGRGVADILCSYKQLWLVIEIKDGNLPQSARKLTPDEAAWVAAQHAPVHIVTSAAEAVGLLNILRR